MNAKSAKLCSICGDRAAGINYNCLSCKSCKIFFFRNFKFIEKLKCRHQGNCPVSYITRACCTSCRMSKCLAVGMSRTNATKKTENTNKSSSIETFICLEIQKNISQFGDNYPEDKPNMAITQRKKRFASDLSAFELQQIEMVKEARKVFGDEFSVPIIRPTSHMVEIFKIPEIYFKWTVQFCKKFQIFTKLSKEDQWALLKYFIWSCTAVHFGFLHDPEKNGYPMFENSDADHAIFVIYDISNGGKISERKTKEISDVNTKFWNSLSEEMGKDTTIRDLLSAQLLFFYHEETSCPEFIKYYHNYYSFLLIRYLEHKFKNINDAKRKYAKLMRILKDLPLVKENERILFSDFDCKHIPELVMEMYHVT